MDLREKIARALAVESCAGVGIDFSTVGDIPLDPWLECADAVIEVLREQEPVAWARFDDEGYLSGLFERYSEGRCPLYALPVPPSEPAVPEAFIWPSPPQRRGQSPVSFDDGYEEGWAKCISTIQAMLAAAPKPGEK